MIKSYSVAFNYKRLDLFLASEADITRSYAKKLINENKVTVNGKIEKVASSVKEGDVVIVDFGEPKTIDLTPQNMPLDIIYEDEYFAVINKAQGVTVHAGGGTKGNTLVNALLFHLKSLSTINGVVRPGIVHRIDKDTSGLLVVAKCNEAHLNLSKQIENKTCHRIYLAILEGVVKDNQGKIETYIGRSEKDRKQMAVKLSGRKAITNYKVIKRYKNHTLCSFSLETGRTHQIRVHSKYIGHPIVGDKVYGYKKQKFQLNGQLLHAEKLILTHPITGKELCFTAPLPDYFKNVIEYLNKTENLE